VGGGKRKRRRGRQRGKLTCETVTFGLGGTGQKECTWGGEYRQKSYAGQLDANELGGISFRSTNLRGRVRDRQKRRCGEDDHACAVKLRRREITEMRMYRYSTKNRACQSVHDPIPEYVGGSGVDLRVTQGATAPRPADWKNLLDEKRFRITSTTVVPRGVMLIGHTPDGGKQEKVRRQRCRPSADWEGGKRKP